MTKKIHQLPLPPHFDPAQVSRVWRVPYQQIAGNAREWAGIHHLTPTTQDELKIHLFLVDVQNTFCIPGFELFVGGASGMDAVEDNIRLCEFIYHNLAAITGISVTLDTHFTYQIFHETFWIDPQGNPPPPYTVISSADIDSGKWAINPQIAVLFQKEINELQAYVNYYVRKLTQSGKYALTIWPFHALLGGIGHAMVASVEEAIFFHSIARFNRPFLEIKGSEPLTEHYSIIKPEIMEDHRGMPIGRKSGHLMDILQSNDAVIIAGQAKSHCVAFSVDDLLDEIKAVDPDLANRVYLLEDCTSPIVIPGGIDYTQAANDYYTRFEQAGMHRVKSTTPLNEWIQIH